MGQVVRARRVAVPVAHRGQLGEARVPLRVDGPVGAHDRRRRELVENDPHDGPRGRGHVDLAPIGGPVTPDERGGRRGDEEQAEEDDRRHGQIRRQQPAASRSCRRQGDGDPGGDRNGGHECRTLDLGASQEDEPEGRAEDARGNGEHHRPALRMNGGGERDERRRDGCGPQCDHQGEGDDLRGGVPAGDEELRVPSEQLEQRLSDGDGAEPEQDGGPAGQGRRERRLRSPLWHDGSVDDGGVGRIVHRDHAGKLAPSIAVDPSPPRRLRTIVPTIASRTPTQPTTIIASITDRVRSVDGSTCRPIRAGRAPSGGDRRAGRPRRRRPRSRRRPARRGAPRR